MKGVILMYTITKENKHTSRNRLVIGTGLFPLPNMNFSFPDGPCIKRDLKGHHSTNMGGGGIATIFTTFIWDTIHLTCIRRLSMYNHQISISHIAKQITLTLSDKRFSLLQGLSIHGG